MTQPKTKLFFHFPLPTHSVLFFTTRSLSCSVILSLCRTQTWSLHTCKTHLRLMHMQAQMPTPQSQIGVNIFLYKPLSVTRSNGAGLVEYKWVQIQNAIEEYSSCSVRGQARCSQAYAAPISHPCSKLNKCNLCSQIKVSKFWLVTLCKQRVKSIIYLFFYKLWHPTFLLQSCSHSD